MSQQPIETGVVLTTDNSQYDQAMTQSASTTDQLGASVDQLAGKLSQLSKSAGRKMLGIAAADVATITAATAAYGAFEKQMTSLNAQAAVLNRNYDQGKRLADSYARSVNGLRREFGTSTTEATALVQTISKMSDHTTSIDKLANTFTKMGHATGESSVALTSSVLQLQKTMGTTQKETEQYANSLTVLAANSGYSATAIADFAQQIAPVGRLVGQSQADIQGISAAFLKSGQDGYRAGTAYNKVLTDIAYATQSGSPELAKYANFVDMTVGSFKQLTGTEKILSFFEKVAKLGPESITALSQMGLPLQTIKSVQAVAQSGVLPSSIAQSQAGMRDKAIDRGSESAMDSLVEALKKLRSELTMTAEAFGEKFAPFAQKFIEGMTKMSDVARTMVEGPFGDLAAVFAGLLASLASLGGGVLLAAPLLAKLAGVAFLTRGSGTLGMRAGFSGTGGRLAPGEPVPGGTQPLSWFQRGQYNALNMAGGQAARIPGLAGFIGGPGDPRGPLWQRTVAGGMNAASFGVRNLLAPLFSPLGLQGYSDPGARQRLFNDPRSPLTQMRDTFRGVPGDQRGPLSQFSNAFRERIYGAPYARGALGLPGSGAMSIDRGVSLFDKDVRVTEEGRVTSGAAKAAAAATMASNAAMTRQTTALSAAFANAARSAGVLAGSMASAAANTMLMAGKGAGGLLKMGASNLPMAGMAALVGGSALGVESNALMFGAVGAMMGSPMAAGAGAAIGYGLDAAQYNKGLEESLTALNAGAQETASTGLGLSGMNDEAVKTQKALSDLDSKFYETSHKELGFLRDPTVFGAASKNLIEGIFGSSDIEELQSDQDKAQVALEKTEGSVRALAEATGTTFTGSRENQLQQMEEFMSTTGVSRLAGAGLTMGDLQSAQNPLTAIFGAAGRAVSGEKPLSYTEMIERIAAGLGPDSEDIDKRIAKLGEYGEAFARSKPIDRAIASPEDANKQLVAIQDTFAAMQAQGLTPGEITRRMGNIRATTKDPDNLNYIVAQGVQQMSQRDLSYRLPMMTRTQGFQAQAEMFQGQRAVMRGDPARQGELLAAQDTFMAAANEQGAYIKQMLLQQREFRVSQDRAEEDFGITRERMDYQYNLSRERAQQDFHITRQQQEEDYQLSRARAQEDFAITQDRAQKAYHRSQRRAQQDFNISRKRQEEDFQHSVQLMVEQQAKSMYNIFDRVKVESSSSANFLLFNAGDQLNRMQKQAADLDRLRNAGISDDVIQQLGLGDTANAQQLSRFVAEVAGNPEMVAEFNKMVRKRLKAAAELTKDESSSEWQEFVRQFKLSRERAGADFDRQVARSHRDFKRGMNEMEQDFRKSMNRQAEDYETAQDRQQAAFSRSMKRAAEDYAVAVDQMVQDFDKAMVRAQKDLNRMAREISGTLEEVLVKGTNRLGGVAGKQSGIILKALRDLDVNAGKEGIQLMKHMSRVFGFAYEPPDIDWTAGNTGHGGGFSGQPGTNPHLPENRAAGGVLNAPKSVGSDNMHFVSKEHGELNLAGGEAIMVPEWVDKMGGPAAVAAMNKAARNGSYWMGGVMPLPGASSISQHHSGYSSDIWAGDLNWPGRADYGKPIVAFRSGIARAFDYGSDTSYGRGVVLSQADGHSSLYAHMSAIAANIIGKMVQAGQTIGFVGDYGNTGSPPTSHLHFELKNGGWSLPFTGDPGNTMPGGIGGGLGSILKERYPKVEEAASRVTIGGGLFPDGFWSKRLNKMARKAAHRLGGAVGDSTDSTPDYAGPDGTGSNQEIVRAAMRAFGWSQWPSLYELVMHESGFNNTAQNPTSTAYGMFQFLDSTWAGVGGHKTSDPQLQALYGMRYIRNRYNDPKGAWDFWQANNWYGDGAIFSGAQQVGVGERGPELALPLNNGGANFLSSLFEKIYVGTEAKQTNVRHSQAPAGQTHTTYQIDRSTTFTGDITVKANSPHDLVHQLKARQRTYALAQQSLGGVRA